MSWICTSGDQINAKIAGENYEIVDILLGIRTLPALMPTVSINAEHLAEKYNLNQERAEAVAALARKHQKGHCKELQPLSLIDIYSPPAPQHASPAVWACVRLWALQRH